MSLTAVQIMLYRQLCIQILIERDRWRRHLADPESTVRLNGLDQYRNDRDILVTAFRQQLDLMMGWSRLFGEMLQDLRAGFPLVVRNMGDDGEGLI